VLRGQKWNFNQRAPQIPINKWSALLEWKTGMSVFGVGKIDFR
jgi:hypothetical protein